MHCTEYEEKTNQKVPCLESVRGTHVFKNIRNVMKSLSKIDPENEVHHKSQTYTMLLDYNYQKDDKKPIYLIIACKTKLLVYIGNLDQRDRQIVERVNNYIKSHNKKKETTVLPIDEYQYLKLRAKDDKKNDGVDAKKAGGQKKKPGKGITRTKLEQAE